MWYTSRMCVMALPSDDERPSVSPVAAGKSLSNDQPFSIMCGWTTETPAQAGLRLGRSAIARCGAGLHGLRIRRRTDEILEALELADDERPVRPRAGERDIAVDDGQR
jgi:hypothetical protein